MKLVEDLIMWKLYMSGCFLVLLINNFQNGDAVLRETVNKNLPIPKTRTFLEVVRDAGYFAEEHFVTTEDGYVLSLHRIYGSPKSPPAPKKSPILLLHGMIAASDVWAMRGPGKDLSYLLVDQGYDVWAINFRGNTYSRKNIHISVNRPEFWRFSWHEMGIYDMPAAIDYVLSQTGLSKITLIGHSMGGTVAYVLLSIRPEYNEKIDVIISLAPVAFFTPRPLGTLATLAQFAREALRSMRRSGVYEFLPHNHIILRLLRETCLRAESINLCREIILRLSGGADSDQRDNFLATRIIEAYPAGASIDTVEHYRQCIANGSFREFDFGVKGNYARYGSQYPPDYPLWKITAPVILYSSLNDMFVIPADIKALENKLPNVEWRVIKFDKFNHFDFIISKKTKELLYDDIINVIKTYKGINYNIV